MAACEATLSSHRHTAKGDRLRLAEGNTQVRLEQYLNARVTVQYGGQALGFSDTGTVSYMDPTWVELTKEKGERLLIPVVSIRHIKLLETPKLAGDSGTLLRASGKQSRDARE